MPEKETETPEKQAVDMKDTYVNHDLVGSVSSNAPCKNANTTPYVFSSAKVIKSMFLAAKGDIIPQREQENPPCLLVLMTTHAAFTIYQGTN